MSKKKRKSNDKMPIEILPEKELKKKAEKLVDFSALIDKTLSYKKKKK